MSWASNQTGSEVYITAAHADIDTGVKLAISAFTD
jgi:hypothetical protein